MSEIIDIVREKHLRLVIVRSGMTNAAAKGARIGRQQTTKDKIPAICLCHYPSYKSGHLNISELSRVCDLMQDNDL